MNRILVSELEFGQEMDIWHYKGTYPLEVISLMVGTDKQGEYYFPVINQYTDDNELIIKHNNGYRSRAKALECVGRCWDKARNPA